MNTNKNEKTEITTKKQRITDLFIEKGENIDKCFLETLGAKVRQWRIEKNISQDELAKLIQVNRVRIVNLEKGIPVRQFIYIRILFVVRILGDNFFSWFDEIINNNNKI